MITQLSLAFLVKIHPFGLVLQNKVKNLIKLNLNLFKTKFSFVKFSDSLKFGYEKPQNTSKPKLDSNLVYCQTD